MIKFLKRLFSKPPVPTKGKIFKEKIVYLAIYPDAVTGGFNKYLDEEWKSICPCLWPEPPKIPYAKVRMQIIELNEKFDNERK